MWKRDESVRPAAGGASAGGTKGPAEQSSGPGHRFAGEGRRSGRDVVNVGKSGGDQGRVERE